MKRRLCFLAILFVAAACNRPLRDRLNLPTTPPQNPSSNKTGSFDGELTSSGVSRHYILHVPANYQGGVAIPLILYTLANHGHSWPGSPVMPKLITSQAVNATDVMWEFFRAHPMP